MHVDAETQAPFSVVFLVVFFVYNLSKASGVHMEVADTGAQLLPAFPSSAALDVFPSLNLGHLSGVSLCGRPV